MKNKIVAVVVAAAFVSTSCVSTPKIETFRRVASEPEVEAIAAQGRDYDFASDQRARPFGGPEVAKLSSGNVKLIDGQLIRDNDEAFDVKL